MAAPCLPHLRAGSTVSVAAPCVMGGETEAGEEGGKDPCAWIAHQLIAEVGREVPHPALPLQVSLLPAGICWGDEVINDRGVFFFFF